MIGYVLVELLNSCALRSLLVPIVCDSVVVFSAVVVISNASDHVIAYIPNKSRILMTIILLEGLSLRLGRHYSPRGGWFLLRRTTSTLSCLGIFAVLSPSSLSYLSPSSSFLHLLCPVLLCNV